MKLIDSDKLYFKLFQEWEEARDKKAQKYEDYYSGYADGMKRATVKTLTAPIVRAAPQWISAKKLFPYNGMKVLFITKSNEIKIGEAGYYSEEINYFDGDKGKTIEAPVFLDDHFEPYFIGDDEVKYWMPIPEIPKEGDDESDKGPLTDRRRGEESMRLIDADALWEEMEKLQNLDGKFANSFTNSAGHRSIEFDRLRDYIDNAPTISEGERGSDGDKQDDQRRTGIHPGSTEISDKEA